MTQKVLLLVISNTCVRRVVISTKYFSEKSITREQVEALKKTLKVYTNEKIIDFNDNFIEHITLEKPMLINPRDSELMDMVEKYLVPWVEPPDDPWDYVQSVIQSGEPDVYSYRSLPSKLKSYMYSVDSFLYETWLRQKQRAFNQDYDERADRLSRLVPDYTDEEYERYVLLGHPMPSPLGRKATESARRSYKTVKDIIRCNIDKFTTFVTLTCAPPDKVDRHRELNESREPGEEQVEFEYVDGKDFEVAKAAFVKWRRSISESLKKEGISFEYIAVWELQRNGAYHFHLLC